MKIHGHRCGRRRMGVVCMCCPRMWVAMVLTGSGRSLHHAAAAPDSGCGSSGGGRVVVASKYRSCPRRRGKPARVIQLKASFNHTAVHPTPHRQYFCRCTYKITISTPTLGYYRLVGLHLTMIAIATTRMVHSHKFRIGCHLQSEGFESIRIEYRCLNERQLDTQTLNTCKSHTHCYFLTATQLPIQSFTF